MINQVYDVRNKLNLISILYHIIFNYLFLKLHGFNE